MTKIMTNRFSQVSRAKLHSSLPQAATDCGRLNSLTCPPLAALKQRTLSQYEALYPGYGHFIRLALNEAEGIAQQTGFPGLFFPALATEKVTAAATWILNQEIIRQNSETALSA
jgi:hypothetical protein